MNDEKKNDEKKEPARLLINEKVFATELSWLKQGMDSKRSGVELGRLVHFEVLASDELRLSVTTLGEVLLTTRIPLELAPTEGLSFTAQCEDLEKFMRGKRGSKCDDITTLTLDDYNLTIEKENGVSAVFAAGKGENFVEIYECDEGDKGESTPFLVEKGNVDRISAVVNRASYYSYYGGSGVWVEWDDSWNTRFAATDGHRLLVEDSTVGGPSVLDKSRTFMLPLLAFRILGKSKTASWMITHLDPADDKNIVKRKVVFEDSGRTVIAFLKDAIFPDYRKITNGADERAGYMIRITNARALADTIREIANRPTVHQENSVQFTFSSACTKIERISKTENREGLSPDLVVIDGTVEPIAFNARYLSDWLLKTDTEVVWWRGSDATTVQRFQSGKNFLYLMPARVNAR